jgi:hypothetical protein
MSSLIEGIVDSGAMIWMLLCLVAAVIVFLLYRFSTHEMYEAEDPEKLAENIMEYRDACLNKIVNFILVRYGRNEEQSIQAYQTDLEKTLIDIPLGEVDIVLSADYAVGKYTLTATAVLPNGEIQVVTDTTAMDDRLMCDYIWVQKFLDEVQEGIEDWKSKTYDLIFKEVGSIAAEAAQQMTSDKLKDEVLYASILEFSHLFEKRKYKKIEFIQPYARLIAYLYASGKQKDFVNYIENNHEEDKEEV